MDEKEHRFDALPSLLGVRIEYYSESHKRQLLESVAGPVLRERDFTAPILLPIEIFLTYYLFYKKNTLPPLVDAYRYFNRKISSAVAELDDCMRISRTGIVVNDPKNTATTCRVGEALSLAFLSWLHGLHEADWQRISETNKRKVLDYDIDLADADPAVSSNGAHYIAVEAKATAVTQKARSALAVCARDIALKKKC